MMTMLNEGISVPRLVLVPKSSHWLPDPEQDLEKALQDMGLAGLELAPGYLAAGEAFLEYLSFLGCAPTVLFEPPSREAIGTGQFYHLLVLPFRSRAVFRSDALTYKPKCPHCKTLLNEWRDWWGDGSCAEQPCPVCGESLNPMMVNWRRRAGCGRVFIDILGIHAETVKPAQRIFDELEARTGTAWQYFFVEDNGAA